MTRTASRTESIEGRAGASGRSRRNGMTMLLVVICLIVVTAIIGAVFRNMALGARMSRQRERKVQAMLLAETALERTAVALQAGADLEDDVWMVSPEQLGGKLEGRVEIQVQPSENGRRVIEARAVYPRSTDFQAIAVRRIEINVAPDTKASSSDGEPTETDTATESTAGQGE